MRNYTEDTEVKRTAILLSVLPLTTPGPATAQMRSPAPVDYFENRFETFQILDWGDRPNWSPDGTRIAFTRSDTEDSSAYEIDVATRKVRCLTCRWGANGLVTRIFYLPDSSFLIEAGPGLETTSAQRGGGSGQGVSGTELYWMPASLALPPQALGAKAFGDIAILSDRLPEGGFRIAFGVSDQADPKLIIADVVHDGHRAMLSNRRVVWSGRTAPKESLVMGPEAYDFADGGAAVTFWTVERGTLGSSMYKLRLDDGALTRFPGDGSHSESHLFPDQRYALEEANRASDPTGPARGLSGIPEFAVRAMLSRNGVAPGKIDPASNSGKPFDLFISDLGKPGRIRQLTDVSKSGARAHQSIPARDGRRIAFSVSVPEGKTSPMRPGLYIGKFVSAHANRQGPRRK